MYTAKSIDRQIQNGQLSVVVEFTNGTDTFTENFYANSGTDPQWLVNRVANKLDSLNSLSDYASTLKLGGIPARSVPAPTPQDIWMDEMGKLKKMNNAVSLGIMSEADDDFIEQRQKVKDTFSGSFIDSL